MGDSSAGDAGSAVPAASDAVPAADAPAADAPAARLGRSALVLASVVVVYYAVPVGDLPSGGGVVLSALGLLGGVTLLGWLMVHQVRQLARRTGDRSVRLDSLVFLVYLVVPLFALGYFALERGDDGQFESLSTKTDALYFTTSTLATVGFGDVHAVGQLARGLVTVQIAFDLVFVAALVSILTGQLRERAAAVHVPMSHDTPDDPPPA